MDDARERGSDQRSDAPREPAVASDETIDVIALRDELERLRTENERLSGISSVTAAERSAKRQTQWALLLVVIAAMLLTVSVPAVWLNRLVFDTDVWVATVEPLAEDPAIQDAVATAASDALIERLDAQKRIEDALPENLDMIAPFISGAVEDLVRKQAGELVRSDQFAKLWSESNRAGHQALVAAVTGREGIVSLEAGTVSFDLGLFVDKLQALLVDRGVDFAAAVPTAKLDRTFTLYESPVLAQLSPIFDAVSRAAFVIPLLGLALAFVGLALAADRRRVALWLGVGIVVAGMLPLQSVYLGQYYATSQLQALQFTSTAAAQSAYAIIFRDLIAASQAVAFLGAVIWLAALVAGPSKWAVALRGGLGGGIAGAAAHLELGSFGAWMAGHKSAMRTIGYVGGFLVLVIMPAPRSIGDIVTVTIGVIVWLLVVEVLGAGTVSET